MTIRFLISPVFYVATAMLGIFMGFPGNKAVAYNSQFSDDLTIKVDSSNQPPQVAISLGLAKQDEAKSINSEKPKKQNIQQKKEYIFRAPPQETSQINKTTYQVQVYGGSQSMLAKVREIEPKAFLKGNLIQVGNFSTQENAEHLLKKLAIKGLWARIVILS